MYIITITIQRTIEIENLYIDTKQIRVEHEVGSFKEYNGNLYIKVPVSHRSAVIKQHGLEVYRRYIDRRTHSKYVESNEWVDIS
ncbi:MAG: hypothetical protein U5P10_00010 [Spirochaetia bacterium]|nr:hypothetical protein [Spirochaetia bacterium]